MVKSSFSAKELMSMVPLISQDYIFMSKNLMILFLPLSKGDI